MIGILGTKRIILLVSFVVINGLLAAALYLHLKPDLLIKDRDLRGLRGEVSTLRTDIDRMQVEFEQLEVQKAEFEALEADGFFKDQSRRQAEKILEEIQKSSGVGKAIASIKAGVLEENEEATKAAHKILRSPIEINIEAFDDVNIFHYIFLVQNYFPGHVAVEKLRIQRDADVSSTVLRAISTGANPTLVRAKLELVWRTMIPESQVIEKEEVQ